MQSYVLNFLPVIAFYHFFHYSGNNTFCHGKNPTLALNPYGHGGGGGYNYCWLVSLHGCISRRRWHLTLSSSFVSNYESRSNILLSVTQTLFGDFYNCTDIVHPLTEVVSAESACSMCTKIGVYWTCPPGLGSGKALLIFAYIPWRGGRQATEGFLITAIFNIFAVCFLET